MSFRASLVGLCLIALSFPAFAGDDPVAVWVAEANLQRQGINPWNLFGTISLDEGGGTATLEYWVARRHYRHRVPAGYHAAVLKAKRARPGTLFEVERDLSGVSPGTLPATGENRMPDCVRFSVNGTAVRLQINYRIAVFSSAGVFRPDYRWISIDGPGDIRRFDQRRFRTVEPVLVHLGRYGAVSSVVLFREGGDVHFVPTYPIEHPRRPGRAAARPRRYVAPLGAVVFGASERTMQMYRDIDPALLTFTHQEYLMGVPVGEAVERPILDFRDRSSALVGQPIRDYEPEATLRGAVEQMRGIFLLETCGADLFTAGEPASGTGA